jgi:hypothetical protein
MSVAYGSGSTAGDRLRPGELDRFRWEFYRSGTARTDTPFELTDAVLCGDGPVRSLVELTLVAEQGRGHGAMYDALAHGAVTPQRLRRALWFADGSRGTAQAAADDVGRCCRVRQEHASPRA